MGCLFENVEPYKVGDKVSKTYQGTKRTGTVTKVYYGKPNHQGAAQCFYEVEWDDTGYKEGGYLFLDRE